MNRKITKTIAYNAAATMKEKAYGRKIENATANVNIAAESLVRKYIPAPVIACTNEFSEYIEYTNFVSISKVVDNGLWTTAATAIRGKITFKIPNASHYFKVDGEEYDALLILDSKRKQLEKERDAFGEQVYDALVALRTERAVERELPEAMKYLEFPEVKAVPMPVFTGLRDILGQIKED